MEQYNVDMDLYAQTSEVNNLMVLYQADKGLLERFYFVVGSPERRERFRSMTEGYEERLQQLDFDQLNVGSRVDYILFARQLEEALHGLTIEAQEVEVVATWFPFATAIYKVEKERRRGAIPDAQMLADQLHGVHGQISALMVALQSDSGLTAEAARRGASVVDGLREALKSVYAFYNGYDPLFTWWVQEPYKQLDGTLAVYGKLFDEKAVSAQPVHSDGSGIGGKPIGRTAIRRLLRKEMIHYTPEELMELAGREFAWCDQQMLEASQELGCGDDWKAALEQVKKAYVLPAHQPQAMLALYNEAIDFLKRHDLLTIPPMAEETWRMNMMSPERQLINPFFSGGEVFDISYPTHTMTHEQKLMCMRGNNPHFSKATVHHELIAGHALQEYMNARCKTYRHFETPFWIEGWTLYWEMLLYKMGFAVSAADRIGMLFWRSHRCARILFSLRYHMGEWTPQQCIDFLVDRVGHERANAQGEVRRSFEGTDGPLYQLAYMVGGLQIMALKEELVDGGEMTYKAFHDAVMQENMLPIELLRVVLKGEKVEKGFESGWRFYVL